MPTDSGEGVPKDGFVVHSKSDEAHAAVVERLVETLRSLGRTIWEYDDWEWEARRKGKLGHHWTGSVNEYDPARHMAGLEPFRRHERYREVSRESLDELFQTSRVLILLAPTSGELSEGSLIEVERITALAGRGNPAVGYLYRPLIIEAGWTDEPLTDFAALAPALRLTLTGDDERDAARLAAVFICAWVVHTLQAYYRVPGEHLLSLAAPEHPVLERLITRSPYHRTLDFEALEERSRQREHERREGQPSAGDIGAFMRHLDLVSASTSGSGHFKEWLETNIAPIRAWVEGQADRDEELGAARSLLEAITANWDESFKRLELAETTLDRASRE